MHEAGSEEGNGRRSRPRTTAEAPSGGAGIVPAEVEDHMDVSLAEKTSGKKKKVPEKKAPDTKEEFRPALRLSLREITELCCKVIPLLLNKFKRLRVASAAHS